MKIGRRETLLGLGAAFSLGGQTASLAAAATSARLVVINMLGGADGLSMIAPYGDPYLARLRAPLMSPAVGQAGGMLDLGGFYGMHPALVNLHAMFVDGEALAVHAVANCATTRSHFDGQDYLQSGAATLLGSGWLNRAASLVPAPSTSLQTGIALNASTPLLIRGPALTAGWSPGTTGTISTALTKSILAASAADPLLGPATRTGFADSAALASIRSGWSAPQSSMSNLGILARYAGEYLAASNGPRIAAIETDSIDTHAGQVGTLSQALIDLDQAFATLRATLAGVWSQTVILTITEFGRTAAVNGSAGTDHGTGFAMLLAGGAVKGGRVIADWPGLAPSKLYQGRDLAPTVDIRAILMGVLRSHLGLPASAMATVFPGAAGISPMSEVVTG